jgi:hypothetical protein
MPAPTYPPIRALPIPNLVSLRRLAKNYLCTLLFMWASYEFYVYGSTYHHRLLDARLDLSQLGLRGEFTSQDLFTTLLCLYAVTLVPFYALQPDLRAKAAVFVEGAWRGCRAKSWWLSWPARQAGLNLLVKFFFAPLMLNWCLAHINDLLHDAADVAWHLEDGAPWRYLFDNGLFVLCFQLILLIDTLSFTAGYLLEAPMLNNRIRSVDPNPWGWFVCLACYPPFNGYVSDAIPSVTSDFPQFINDQLHFVLNGLILLAMGIYSWASVALGFKASNLTNRGLVSRGPYRWVRHPAYTCKNLAWWIGTLPFCGQAFAEDWQAGMRVLVCMSAWTFIYILRAITEERHMLRSENDYRAYMEQVRWRFVPGIF